MSNWESDISNYDIITDEKAKLLLSECKDNLNATISNANILDNKIHVFLGFLMTVIMALLAQHFSSDNYSVLILLCIILLLAPASILVHALSPKPYCLPGDEPKNLLTQAVCEQEYNYMVSSVIEMYQNKIEQNVGSNENKAKNLVLAIKVLFWAILPLLLLLNLLV